MNGTTQNTTSRQAAVSGLAIVGFVALVALGIWLAVYSARYVPTAVGRIGAAAVSLSSIFVSSDGSGLSVVPPATTTIPFGGATSTPATTTTPVTKPATPVSPQPGTKTSGVYPIGTGTATLYGLPDLVVTIDAVGYLATSSPDSFVAASTVPHGMAAAVKFTVKNVGTNVAGPWRFSASIPTTSSNIYQSIPQQSLNPGDYIDFTLGFTQGNAGLQTISVTANYDHAVVESSSTNDSASAQVTILGS